MFTSFINKFGYLMKKIITLLLVTFVLTACAPKIGSEEWCSDMKEKPKGDWTATETKDFTKHCIF
jgi:hypothetical protein